MSRQTRDQQLVFVNGRAVENPVINAALREGYHTALMKGQNPVTFLFVGLDPGGVDVNVHPAKREVRFREPTAVREAIVEAVQRTLESGRIDWQRKFRAPIPTAGAISRPRPFPSKVYRPGVRHRLNDPFRARLKSVRGVHRGNPMSLKPRRQPRLSNRPCRSRCLAVEPIPDSPAANRHAASPRAGTCTERRSAISNHRCAQPALRFDGEFRGPGSR